MTACGVRCFGDRRAPGRCREVRPLEKNFPEATCTWGVSVCVRLTLIAALLLFSSLLGTWTTGAIRGWVTSTRRIQVVMGWVLYRIVGQEGCMA